MLPSTSLHKTPKSPGIDAGNSKTAVTCTNVPEGLFDAAAAKKHFSKFGRVQKIRLLPKRQACIIEYDQPVSVQRALLNAGAFDGFMFDVTRTKPRTRRKSKREDDPDWVPSSDVEEELSAMSGAPSYRITRPKSIDVVADRARPKTFMKGIQQSPIRRKTAGQPSPIKNKTPAHEKPLIRSQPTSGTDSPVVVTTQTTLSTVAAAGELNQLRSKVSVTPDEQWRILDARDRILRAWGGAGSRVKVGGATIGTCQDMCPEKELLHRQAEHQVMTLETVVDSDGQLEPWRAVKQYSRSSADQEIPMCYELRPASALMRTCAYLLHEIADTTRQVTLSDWFHFMWDRLRSIRKDIAQQALCCAESIRLVEMCARFHAHCAARLADLEHSQFDPKLNTDNLAKCLQTLKHMYADVTPDQRPREVEFRGYIALLNLGDANFWWEIKQLPHEMQKSEPIVFAIQVFNALDNNNYVRFFRLVQQKATYLQACILLRYFNDVRARALARIVKAYAPRGGSRFPAADLMSALAFEAIENMKSFINHYGLRFGRIEEHELSIILSRHQFIEDSDPYPIGRAINLIESKRQCSVGEVIAGGPLPNPDYSRHLLYSSFTRDGKLKESALIAEEQGFNTLNDSNKDVKELKAMIHKVAKGEFMLPVENKSESNSNLFVNPETKAASLRSKPAVQAAPPSSTTEKKVFSFKPAIMIEDTDVVKISPEKIFNLDNKNKFSFSKPQETTGDYLFTQKDAGSIFAPATSSVFENKAPSDANNLFTQKATLPVSKTLFQSQAIPGPTQIFENKPTPGPKSLFQNPDFRSLFPNNASAPKNSFGTKAPVPKGLFENTPGSKNSFALPQKSLIENTITPAPKNVFANKVTETKMLFEKTVTPGSKGTSESKSLFGRTMNEERDPFQGAQNVFKNTKPEELLFNKPDIISQSIFGQNVAPKQPIMSKNVFENIPKTNTDNVDGQAMFSKSIFSGAKENPLFAKPVSDVKFDTGKNIFARVGQETKEAEQPTNMFARVGQETKEAQQPTNIFSRVGQETKEAEKPNNIFAPFNKAPETKNIFAKPDINSQISTQSIFTPNGDAPPGQVSSGTFSKNVFNPTNGSDAQGYSIFQSKNKAQTVADNIVNSVNANTNNSVYDFNQNDKEQQEQLAMQRMNEEKLRAQARLLEEMEFHRREALLQEEKLRRQEQKRREDELFRQEELRRIEEKQRQVEAQKKQEELRLLEEQHRREEQKKQEELRKRLEEERKAELKRLAEEKERKFREAVQSESTQLVVELINEVSNETSKEIMKEEQEKLRVLVQFANDSTEEIIRELCNKICHAEMKAEMFLTFKIMRKWFYVWRLQLHRNLKRRSLLEDTPVWLPERTPIEKASHLRRKVENSALKNMNEIHRGYKFTGELKQIPSPQPYNLMEVIRSPLLKRMKQISYPYDKCFFWKVTLVAPGEDEWLCRKINVQKWLIDAFSDKNKHEESETLIHVGKESWNHLMDFAISVSLINKDKMMNCAEAVEGTNSIIFYSNEQYENLNEIIQLTLKLKYPYQIVPVAVIMPKTNNTTTYTTIQNLLASYVEQKIISEFKIYVLDPQNISELLNASTKKALKWLAKKYPETPPLEIDSLKSVCQRYLGNEIWCRFRTEQDGRMDDILKDIQKLIRCYNAAVDKLAFVITNEDLFNYTSFPLEFQPYLDHTSPFPKPYEFIPSNVRTSENISMIKDILRQLKLPNPSTDFNPLSVVDMQQQIRTYCNQIGWFENPEEVVCKVVAVMPNELSDLNISSKDFTQYFAHYDLIEFLNIIVYEKINRLNRFDNRFAIYETSVLHEYRNVHWLYMVDAFSQIKHKAIEYEDDLDYYMEAKRRKLAMDSLEYLILEDKDSTLVEENMKETDTTICKYSNCTEAVKQLERKIDEGKKKSLEFENMLRAALADV